MFPRGSAGQSNVQYKAMDIKGQAKNVSVREIVTDKKAAAYVLKSDSRFVQLIFIECLCIKRICLRCRSAFYVCPLSIILTPNGTLREHLSSKFDETAGQVRVVRVDTSSWQSHPERQSFPRLEIEKARVTSAIKRSAGPCVACVYHDATLCRIISERLKSNACRDYMRNYA